jgi:surface antigen
MKAGKTKASALIAWAKTRFLGAAVSLTLGIGAFGLGTPAALAHTATSAHHHHSRHYASRHRHLASRSIRHHHYAYYRRHGSVRDAHYHYSWIQCVPYAREVSHIALSGDAFLWWAEASGRYARGAVPAEGAVLNFRSIGRMPLGHVAVVTSVIDRRTILVTQANWVHGTITNDVTMQDVSPNNDWTQVEVELGDNRHWGAAYPTYGFIYNQPATSTVIAAATPNDEVAEAPRPAPIATDAPNRNLQ